MADTDHKRLLEMAAKAAGISIMPCTCSDPRWPFKHDESKSRKSGHWNPLVDDAHAMRLVVQCGLEVSFVDEDAEVRACVGYPNDAGRITYVFEDHRGDIFAATRLAVTRAAAAIGEKMP